MEFRNLVPTLRVLDLEESIAFYREVLGFECANRIEGWASMRKDDVELILALPNAHEPFDKPKFTGSFYFHTDTVDEWWKRLKDRAEVVYPVENFDYGMREFAVLDNNGYCLQFGSEIG